MKKYLINHENRLEENKNGNLVSVKDFEMMKMRMEGDAKILTQEHEAKIKDLQDQIQILQWKLDAV